MGSTKKYSQVLLWDARKRGASQWQTQEHTTLLRARGKHGVRYDNVHKDGDIWPRTTEEDALLLTSPPPPTCAYVCQKTLQHGLGSVRGKRYKETWFWNFHTVKIGTTASSSQSQLQVHKDSKPPPHPLPASLTPAHHSLQPPPGDPRLGLGNVQMWFRRDGGRARTGLPLRVGWAVWWREIRGSSPLQDTRVSQPLCSVGLAWFLSSSLQFSRTSGWKDEEFGQEADVEANPYQTSGGHWHFMQMASFSGGGCRSQPCPQSRGLRNPCRKSKGLPCAFGDTGVGWESCTQGSVRAQGRSQNRVFVRAVTHVPFYVMRISSLHSWLTWPGNFYFKKMLLLIWHIKYSILYAFLWIILLAINCTAVFDLCTKSYVGPLSTDFARCK